MPGSRLPTGALIVQAVWACILVIIFSSSFDTLTDYAIFGLSIFYALCTAAVFILRRKLPDIEALGEEVRRRVLDKTGVRLEWEIRRLGVVK